MPEPVSVGVAAKIAGPLAANALRVGGSSIWQYLRGGDSKLPTRKTVAKLAEWLHDQFIEAWSDDPPEHIDEFIDYLTGVEFTTLVDHIIAISFNRKPDISGTRDRASGVRQFLPKRN